MKLTTDNKKRTTIEIILLVVSIGGIVFVYFTFLSPPPDDGSIANQHASLGDGTSQSELLPYGKTIDTTILEDESFRVLKASPPVSVSAEELGKDDLFAQ